MRTVLLSLALGALACGGTKKSTDEPGSDHDKPDANMSAWGGGAEHGNSSGEEAADGGVSSMPTTGPVEPQAEVTFELQNNGKTDLVFTIDKGWQPVLFAYSGKPPKAKSVLLFPLACTETCDAELDVMCPVCKEEEDPKKHKQQEKDETKREVAPAGESVRVPWDGRVFAYEKAPKEAKKKHCECWRKVDVTPATYTVKACGIRPSTKPGKPSTPECAEAQVDLPLAPQSVVTLSFK